MASKTRGVDPNRLGDKMPGDPVVARANLPAIVGELDSLTTGRVRPTTTALEVVGGVLSEDEWEAVGEAVALSGRASTWWAGDWYNAAPKAARDSEYAEKVAERFGYQIHTLRSASWVCNAIEPARRRPELPWLHHLIVAAMPHEEQDRWLDAAIEGEWPASRFKREIQMGDWAPVEDSIVLPGGKFQLLYADPPWPTAGGSKANYPTMSIGEIESLSDVAGRPVSDLADDPSILFMWCVNEYLEGALAVMQAWGFTYRSNLVWDKVQAMGLGAWVRQRHELLLIGTRGSFPHPHAEDRLDSVLAVKKGRHSEKPAAVREWLEKMYPPSRKVELFARTAPKGWAVFGNQAPAGDGS